MLNVTIHVLRGFNELGTLTGQLDETKLPMHKPDEASDQPCIDALKAHLLNMETHANAGSLRLHVDITQ